MRITSCAAKEVTIKVTKAAKEMILENYEKQLFKPAFNFDDAFKKIANGIRDDFNPSEKLLYKIAAVNDKNALTVALRKKGATGFIKNIFAKNKLERNISASEFEHGLIGQVRYAANVLAEFKSKGLPF